MPNTLRSDLIRLAAAQPALRSKLLTVLAGSASQDIEERLWGPKDHVIEPDQSYTIKKKKSVSVSLVVAGKLTYHSNHPEGGPDEYAEHEVDVELEYPEVLEFTDSDILDAHEMPPLAPTAIADIMEKSWEKRGPKEFSYGGSYGTEFGEFFSKISQAHGLTGIRWNVLKVEAKVQTKQLSGGSLQIGSVVVLHIEPDTDHAELTNARNQISHRYASGVSSMSTSPLRSAVIRLAHTLPQYRKVLLAALTESASEKEGKFEEGVSADPTENMSPEDAAEWKKQNELHKDQFKAAGRKTAAAELKPPTDEFVEIKKQLQLLVQNPPRVVPMEGADGKSYHVIQVFSPIVKKYIPQSEYRDAAFAQKELAIWERSESMAIKNLRAALSQPAETEPDMAEENQGAEGGMPERGGYK